MKSMRVLLILFLGLGLSAAKAQDYEVGEEGKNAPQFGFVSPSGEDFELSDFKGKVVLIDFWASWCGPCKREMPYADKIKKHFAQEDVVFLNISVDRNEMAWKNTLRSLDVKGVNGIAKGKDLQAVANGYKLYSIPAFVLVDKKGKLIAMRANRPSSGEKLITQIEDLL